MSRFASIAGVLLIFGLLLLALFNLDHRKDRNVPGATTPPGQNSLAPKGNAPGSGVTESAQSDSNN
jgi:hypothetical protein